MSNELDADLKYWLAFDPDPDASELQAAWNATPEELANAGMDPVATSHPPDALLEDCRGPTPRRYASTDRATPRCWRRSPTHRA